MTRPIAWTIAGSDSGGGAGIQADLHAFQAAGVHGCSVVTVVTAQNSMGVTAIHNVPAEHIDAQIKALSQDLTPKAIKLGVLGDQAAFEYIRHYLQSYTGKIVLDPVLIATSTQPLFTDTIDQRIAMIMRLLPLATVVTPNLSEAKALLGKSIDSYADMTACAQQFLALGARSVVIKGGHYQQDGLAQDYWTDGKQAFWLANARGTQADYHGSGCSFAAAIAAQLAHGSSIEEALVLAKMYVTTGIYNATQYGAGPAPVAHGQWQYGPQSLPKLAEQPVMAATTPFADCGDQPLGLYPIVDSAMWLEKLLPHGVTTIQLRIKDKVGEDLVTEIKAAIATAKKYRARLFINDYWQLAIEYGGYGVHLGQEDLTTADVEQIKRAGLRLGISSHNYYELARAQAILPSYIALGPIYPTTSKVMPHGPQGIARLRQWRSLITCPLAAIGGIGLAQMPAIMAAGADGVAVLSAITQADDPVKVTKQMLESLAVFLMDREQKEVAI